MPFPFMAIAGMGMQAAGAHQAGEATVEGAQAQAEIEALNRAYQEKLFGEEMERLRPRMETATQQGLPLYQRYVQEGGIGLRGDRPEFSTVVNPDYDPEQAAAYQDFLAAGGEQTPLKSSGGRFGGLDAPAIKAAESQFEITPYTTPGTIQRKNMYLEDMPLYNMQAQAGQDYLASQGFTDPYTTGRFTEGLGAAENDAGYARLQDLMQIGMGASESAGAGAGNFATRQAGSLINTGNVLAGGQQQAANIRNSMYQNLAGQAGQIPAYMAMNQRPRPVNLQGPDVPLGGIGGPMSSYNLAPQRPPR